MKINFIKDVGEIIVIDKYNYYCFGADCENNLIVSVIAKDISKCLYFNKAFEKFFERNLEEDEKDELLKRLNDFYKKDVSKVIYNYYSLPTICEKNKKEMNQFINDLKGE